MLRTIFINIVIGIILLLLVELFMGDWIFHGQLNNLNLLKNQEIEVPIKGFYPFKKDYISYTRDGFGLRGSAFNHPEKIKVLTVGGSTTDQRYIDDSLTWQMQLEGKFLKHKIPIVFGNAGVDGHSTFAHLKSFETWFSQIPNLKPKYILFYIGINDFCINEGHERDELYKNLLQKSALYQLVKKIKNTRNGSKFSLSHQGINASQINFTNRGKVTNTNEYEYLIKQRKAAYKKRLIKLVNLTKALGAEPIFILQPTYFYCWQNEVELEGTAENLFYDVPINGVDYYYLKRKMDETCIQVAMENKLLCIDIGNTKNWQASDFYDYVHLTLEGTNKLAEFMYKPLYNKFIAEQINQ